MGQEINFTEIAASLLPRAHELLGQWFPAGKFSGSEFSVGSLRGEAGSSLKVSLTNGKWADFATGDKGGDLISLYAMSNGLKQSEAAKILGGHTVGAPPEVPRLTPPVSAPRPQMWHGKHGAATAHWRYQGRAGETLFYVARYDGEDGKQFCWFTWDGSGWQKKAWPNARPLYGLELLDRNPEAPVLLVEGEKAADAARVLANHVYIVMTWPGGSNGWGRADFSAIHGRNVLLWPDADEPGVNAMSAIGAQLVANCPQVKIIDVSGHADGWDAADALADGWTFERLVEWAKPRATVMSPLVEIIPPMTEPVPESPDDMPDVEPGDTASSGKGISANVYAEWESLGIEANANGSATCNLDNALHVLERRSEFKDLIWYDEFHHRYFTKFDFGTWRESVIKEWDDIDTLNLTYFMQRHLALKNMKDDTVHKAVKAYARRNTKNEPRDWLDSLKWDGNERLGRMFAECFGSKDREYEMAAGKNMFTGIAARIYKPGCQLDNMIILEGSQGAFKTSALRVIGGPWHTEAKESVQSKDFFLILHGKLIIEMSEMHEFSKADVTKIKQILTCTIDRYRIPFERAAADHPRMSVFVGTTNESNYLRDSTGGRRFWPIACGAIDLGLLATWREQLFAEGVHRFKAGEKWHEMPKDDTVREQEARRQHDAWEDEISKFLDYENKTEITPAELAHMLKIDMARLDMIVQRRIANVMRILGWRKERRPGLGTVWVSGLV